MDQLKLQIQHGYRTNQVSSDDLESLETLIQTLLKPIREKKKEQQAEKAKRGAWKQFWKDISSDFGFEIENNLALISHLNEIGHEWDIRTWSGGYTGESSTYWDVSTTPYLYSKDIYLKSDECECGGEWSDNLNVSKEEYKQIMKQLTNLKNNQLWRYLDCPNCDDKCKCWKLNDLDNETFQGLLDQPNRVIELSDEPVDYFHNLGNQHYLDQEISYELNPMENNLEKLLKFYISNVGGSDVIYLKDYRFGELC